MHNEKLIQSLTDKNPELFWDTISDMIVNKIEIQDRKKVARLFENDRLTFLDFVREDFYDKDVSWKKYDMYMDFANRFVDFFPVYNKRLILKFFKNLDEFINFNVMFGIA